QYGDTGLDNQRSSYFNTDSWKEKQLQGKIIDSECNLPIHFSGLKASDIIGKIYCPQTSSSEGYAYCTALYSPTMIVARGTG
ncbi:hypothetical protein ACSLNW_26950, partial [Escherichia coli]